jgi:hypothetical protein
MPTVTLLTRVYNDSQLRLVEKKLQPILKGLKVEIGKYKMVARGWPQTEIFGEDEKVASRCLADDIGLCPMTMENLRRFSTITGHMVSLNNSNEQVCVDVGVFSPKIVDASLSLSQLQAQLVDGRKFALKKIVELFDFCENLPLTVKILKIDEQKSQIEASLAEKQLLQYETWTKSLLDRLAVLGASLYETQLAIKKAHLQRDIVKIEPLGLFEQAIVCKLGTDAKGLIPRIGKSLHNATFNIFQPKKILQFHTVN